MTAAPPPHAAAALEPIPDPSPRPGRNEPDMREVTPIDVMLADLGAFDEDDFGYVETWRRHLASIGNSVSAHYERDGSLHLMAGGPVDAQTRHRSRWQHFLIEDLDRLPGRRELLLATLEREGHYADNRPSDLAATTLAIRSFLLTGGRLLINPEGRLEEGAEVGRRWTNGTDADREAIQVANRAYFAARRRWRADRQIKRAVRMLGTRTANGWVVLEART